MHPDARLQVPGCSLGTHVESLLQALKEVYLPECGVWVSDYPFLKREAYLECSLEIERERQQELAQGGR